MTLDVDDLMNSDDRLSPVRYRSSLLGNEKFDLFRRTLSSPSKDPNIQEKPNSSGFIKARMKLDKLSRFPLTSPLKEESDLTSNNSGIKRRNSEPQDSLKRSSDRPKFHFYTSNLHKLPRKISSGSEGDSGIGRLECAASHEIDDNLTVLRCLEAEHKVQLKKFSEHIAEQANEVVSLTKRVSELLCSTKCLETSLMQSELENAELKNQKMIQEAEIRVLEQKCSTYVDSIRERDDRIQLTVSKISALEKDLEAQVRLNSKLFERCLVAERDVAEKSKELDLCRRTTDELIGANSSLEVSLNEARSFEISQQDNLKTKIEEVSKLKSEMRALETSISELKKTCTSHEKDLNRAEDAMTVIAEENTSLMNKLAASHEENIQLNTERSDALKMLADHQAENSSLRKLLRDLEETNSELVESVSNYDNQVRLLTSESSEKDEIISGDTKKISELVAALTAEKQAVEDLRSRAENCLMQAELSTEVEKLKEQMTHAREKTDRKILEIAEQLYHQYSKKHELKVFQLKERYEAKLKEREAEVSSKKQEIENLNIRLENELKDKNYLLSVLEEVEGKN